ncbi:bifunctional [glutamine synthetase] adenylyltransferase/[glutamine synthetase]-adenylyl-L-tyrosine phosphorylase [Qipengyuania sp. DSG2-2]|uniref:bifunctional [glutamine synthetase] adenylyltransferase/[glutamine synthetase]-adenylyl-L-tyrosine phosphorylase n=1 Tax=Qipengyuania sp. DGS2-2 TaxID=3349631 RepID=UPI0036D2D142
MTKEEPDWTGALERARAYAPFLARTLVRRPELEELLAAGRGEEALDLARHSGEGQAEGVALRRERLGLALTLAVGDLAGAFELETVTGALSSFADDALGRAIRAAIARRVEDADDSGFYALALGKHGAGELNYSSDIDPILLYDPARMARRERDEPGEAAQRYAREIVQLLSENTAEGYVFRVDLRLRPASEVSPLAISEGAALTHYESSALPWERAAFLRARACSGDIAAGENFLAAIDPFIWRRSLDFGAIAEIGALTSRIRQAHDGPKAPGPGYNVKLGRGGIREIEFFVQTHQLIHGGRNPGLRHRGLFRSLEALVEAGLVPRDDAEVLAAAYRRLRTVEHRLQMVEDRQTHSLPSGDALGGIARLDGLDNAAALVADLEGYTKEVGALFDQLLEQVGAGPSFAPLPQPGEAIADADGLPSKEKARMRQRIEGWLDGRYRTLRSPNAQAAFRSLLPKFLDAIADTPEPDQALLRWEKLLATMPSAINLFRLLEARPGLLDQLLRILSLAPPLADELARSPALLDALIDQTALDLPADVAALEAAMRPSDVAQDYERALDRLRVVTGEQRFALGVQLIEGAHDPLDIAAGLSRVAEAAVQRSVAMAEEEFAKNHGRIAGSDLVVLGLGRLGGCALTHASDLDLVTIFTGDFAAESDGEKPLGGTLYFNRLAQRVGAALSVPTAQGALYEVDTRLRPQGAQGPLAVSLDSFARYQQEDAWTWEHMALTRARVVAGPPEARKAVERELDRVLCMERDPEELRAAVLKMREDMAQHKPPKGPLDAKLLRGGLVDLEFLIHHQQLLSRKGLSPRLPEGINGLASAGLLPDGLADAHDFLTRLIVGMRLLAPDSAMPEGARGDVLCSACRVPSPSALLKELQLSRQCVAQGWEQFLNTKLEID